MVNLQTNLNSTRYGQFSIPVPPPAEQNLIVDHVATETGALRDAIERTKSEITLLRDYRIRLIADVVTGKLDVREAAVRLPDEAEELELLDEADSLAEAEEDAADDIDASSEEVEA